MGKLIADRSGKLIERAFYRFEVPMVYGNLEGARGPSWITARLASAVRKPTDDEYPWIYIEDSPEEDDRIRPNPCPIDPLKHASHSLYRRVPGIAFEGKVPPLIVTLGMNGIVGLSTEMRNRISKLPIRGARIDNFELERSTDGRKIDGIWALQFAGKSRLRAPKFVDAPNRCPYCNVGKVLCDACGALIPSCDHCKKSMIIPENLHEGERDKRLAFELDLWLTLDGRTWDGGDLIQAAHYYYASKRFIDWLLKVHAAPFDAEPCWMSLDGMSDQQKKWLDEVQRPFEM